MVSKKFIRSWLLLFDVKRLQMKSSKNFLSDKGWLELDAAVKSGLPPCFGTRLSAIVDSYLSESRVQRSTHLRIRWFASPKTRSLGHKLVAFKDQYIGLGYSWLMLFEDKGNKLKNDMDAKDAALREFLSSFDSMSG